MNKEQLCNEVAEETFYTQKSVAYILDAILKCTENALKRGDKVNIQNFGSMVIKDRKARTGRNPHTNEPVPIPARKMPYFEPSDALKERCNEGA